MQAWICAARGRNGRVCTAKHMLASVQVRPATVVVVAAANVCSRQQRQRYYRTSAFSRTLTEVSTAAAFAPSLNRFWMTCMLPILTAMWNLESCFCCESLPTVSHCYAEASSAQQAKDTKGRLRSKRTLWYGDKLHSQGNSSHMAYMT